MVPSGWKDITLGDLVVSSAFGPRFSSDLYCENGTIGTVRTTDLCNEGMINYKTIPYADIDVNQYKSHVLRDGNLLITRSGTCGVPCIFEEQDKPIIAAAFLIRFILKENVSPKYLHILLKDSNVQHKISNMASGGVQKNLTGTNLKKLKLIVPEYQEQQKIAKILGTWDKAISTTERLIDNIKQQKKALMQQLLSGDNKGKRLLDDSGKPFEGDWEEVTIGLVASLTAGGTPSTKHPEYWGGDISWMNSGEVNLKQVYGVVGRITELGLQKSSTKEIPENSILIALAGQGKTRGTVAINRIKLCTNQSIAAIMPNEQKLDPNFLYFNLDDRYQELRSISTGDGGRGGLNLSILKSIKLKLPSLAEQQKIASVLTNADKEIELLEQQLSYLKQEKKALMQQLLTGKRRVKVEQEPVDLEIRVS